MIGNDIVDLSSTQIGEGQRRSRFLKKIFTDEEINQIQRSKCKNLMIWLMWSIKESVYKIVARQEERIRYAPKSIECKSINALKTGTYLSTVIYNNQYFTARSIINGDCIHTIALEDGFSDSKIQSASFDIINQAYSSSIFDRQIIETINDSQACKNRHVIIKRDQLRIPRVYSHDKEIAALSMSHHGRFQGFAYVMNDIKN